MNISRTGTFVAIQVIVVLNFLIHHSPLSTLWTSYFAFVPLRFTQSMQTFDNVAHEIATLVTYQFIHGSLQHLSENMFFLVLFGWFVEREFGSMRFLGFYLASGVFGALGLWALNTDLNLEVIGASGAVGAVFGAFLILLIRRRSRLTQDKLWLTIITALGGMFILLWWLPDQIIGSILIVRGAMSEPLFGYLCHLFGFIAGAILTWRYCSRTAD